MVLARWRRELDVLAITAVWAPTERVPGMVLDATAVARSRGFGSVLSPLLERRSAEPYERAGMRMLVELTGYTRAVPHNPVPAAQPPVGIVLRAGGLGDVASCVELDAICFDEFWRHGTHELETAVAAEHLTIAVDDRGRAAGYAVSSTSGSTVTVGRLAVAPWARRRGIAMALVADAIAWAQAKRAVGVSLCTQSDNAEAKALYRSAGFTESPEPYALLLREV